MFVNELISCRRQLEILNKHTNKHNITIAHFVHFKDILKCFVNELFSCKLELDINYNFTKEYMTSRKKSKALRLPVSFLLVNLVIISVILAGLMLIFQATFPLSRF